MMLSRRNVLALCAGGIAARAIGSGPATAQATRDYRFRVIRDGSEIGIHTVIFQESGGRTLVRTNIALQVRVAFVTAFRYRHDCDEEWSGGRLVAIRSRTDDNGNKYEVEGRVAGDAFRTVGPAGPFTMPANLLTSNDVWTVDFVKQQALVNAQEGGEVGISVKRVADEVLSGAGGAVSAAKYRVITPRCAGFVWYGPDGRWLRSVFEVKGETLNYEAA